MIRPEDIDALVEGRFELPFLELRLRKNDPEDSHEYKGPGEIRQADDGQLTLRLFDPTAPLRFPPPSWPAGQIVPQKDYYTLEGRAMDGSIWRAEHLLPHESWAAGSGGCLVTARVWRVTSVSKSIVSRGHHRLVMVVPEPLRLPGNAYTKTETTSGSMSLTGASLDTAEFHHGELHFHCRALKDRTVIDVRASRPHRHLDTRVIESLQFLLGRKVQPVHVHWDTPEGEVDQLLSFQRADPRYVASILPPLRLDPLSSGDAWTLFALYLSFVSSEESENFHPISAEWETLIHSSLTGVEGRVLVAAVAAEAILKIVDLEGAKLKPELPGDDAEVASWIERILDFVRANGGEPRIIKRIKGFFSSLLGLTTSHRFKRLASKGVVDGRLVQNWGTLRNTRGHGVKGGVKAPEEVVAAYDAIIGLLYQLVFYAVGYKGQYLAYGEYGWPTRQYPSELTGPSSPVTPAPPPVEPSASE